MQQITLEVILRTVFGVDDAARLDALAAQLTHLLHVSSRPRLWAILLPRMFYRPRAELMRERAVADAMIYDQIARRRRAGDAGERTDVLSMLLGATDEDGAPMTDEEIRDELMTLLVAGHETSATSLAWTVDCVVRNPEVYDRLRDEVDREIGGGPITDSALQRCTYLEGTIKESLRLRPILPMVVRKLAVPMTIHGFDLPAGTIVGPNIYLTGRRADLWPDATSFRPERFAASKLDPYRWLPFGGGIRRCLGMAFALYEMRIVLAALIRDLDLAVAPGAVTTTRRRGITLAPSDGVRVVVRGRRRSVSGAQSVVA